MAEQVYVYGATSARPASYSYSSYATDPPNAAVQPVYSVNVQQPGPTYTYDPSHYPPASLASATGAVGGSTTAYAQSDYATQPAYTVQVVAASQQGYAPPAQASATAYAQTPSGAYAAVPVGASPYATTVVAPAGATSAYAAQAAEPSSALTYGQTAYVSQPSYVQSHAPGTQVYTQLSMPQAAAPATGQPAAYGVPAAGQAAAYAQPGAAAGAQQPIGLPAGYGQHQAAQTLVFQQAAPNAATAAAYGQTIAQQAPPSAYAAPTVQPGATAYGQAPPGMQPAGAYATQPPQAQLPPPAQPTVFVVPAAAQQPAPYGLPPAIGQPQQVAGPRPTLAAPPYGRSMSPGDLYDRSSVGFVPGARAPPGALIGPSAVLNAVLGGSRNQSATFSRDRDGHSGGYGGQGRNDGSGQQQGPILEDTIFIQGLPEHVTEDLLAKHFAAVGTVKSDPRTGKPRVWLCRDKVTGRPRGDGIVGYEQVHAATAAIARFHRSEFLGVIINVRNATRKLQQPGQSIGRTGRGDGTDWTCTVANCGNQNFGWRTECNRCKAPRPGAKDGGQGRTGGDSGRGTSDADDNSDHEGSDGRASPGDRNSYNAGRGGMSRGGQRNYGDRGRGGGPMRGGMMRGRGGPVRGRDRFERRDHPY